MRGVKMNNRTVYLVNEDFSSFSIGDFPFDLEHSALGEYHLYPIQGDHGIWLDPICNYTYRGPSWIITENEDHHYMEQMRQETTIPHRTYPMLSTGDLAWHDYTISTKLHMFNTTGSVGLGFCYHTSLNLYVLVFENQQVRLIYRHNETAVVLAEIPYAFNCDDFYELKVELIGATAKCYVNNNFCFEYSCDAFAKGGKIAITADMPTQYEWVKVSTSKTIQSEIQTKIQARVAEEILLQEQYPKMRLWKKIDLQNFGTGRQIRFGHLTGTDEWYIVFAQCQKRVFKDSYATISCLTAIDLDGNILWQRGEPSNNETFGLLSADLPLQIYDIDGDGIDEVITSKNFELLILDGPTGRVKKRTKTPFSDDDPSTLIGIPFNNYAFDRINPDAIRIVNFSGKERPSDILIKDRYCRLYALNNNLEIMWKFKNHINTGHFPYAFDIDGDGKDELFCGYNLIDHDGSLIWTLPIVGDHTDEIIVGKFIPNSDKGMLAIVSGTKGFMLVDFEGNIIKKEGIGHAQRVSAGNYRPGDKGFEICATNYWGHQGIIYCYNYKGETLWELENGLNGNIIAPVNWVGDGTDLILTNADTEKGGLLDGEGRVVVRFPNDNHPSLCVECISLFGDSRDEIVVWDQKQMYIYTSKDNPLPTNYTPAKFPYYNASNYRGEYSFPDKSYIFE